MPECKVFYSPLSQRDLAPSDTNAGLKPDTNRREKGEWRLLFS